MIGECTVLLCYGANYCNFMADWLVTHDHKEIDSCGTPLMNIIKSVTHQGQNTMYKKLYFSKTIELF